MNHAVIHAQSILVRGVVQGVGFRPYVFRLAQSHALSGWVRNGEDGVQIHVEGPEPSLAAFLTDLAAHPPPAARIAGVEVAATALQHVDGFDIRESRRAGRPTARISPDLPVCEACLREMRDASDRRHGYPYINCTGCGPRYSIIRALPYDRSQTTMAGWPMCAACAREYEDPLDRRFHAQPVACPACGPHYVLVRGDSRIAGDAAAIDAAARVLQQGGIVAVKGLGGYHLACDADNARTVLALRERKYRKEKPFAVMVRGLEAARQLVALTPESEQLLTSIARPIAIAPSRVELMGVAPGHRDLGVMLAYTPLHHLLFDAGAPEWLVMTSGNRSSEPIAFRDDDALVRLGAIADAFLVGERPIARRIDDSVVRAGACGPAVLRRSRGLAPGAAARLPGAAPILAVGADLKNTVTLVVGGQAYVSQHVGDLEHYDARDAFRGTIRDLMAMYDVSAGDLVIAHDLHPQYASSAHAAALPAKETRAVQHHRAHVASVLAERDALDRRVIGVAYDGTGYGDDGTIWGGELFVGSVRDGFDRIGHARQAALPGGDAAARFPVQAAAGFVSALDGMPDLTSAPFGFGERYRQALALIDRRVRLFPASSIGRLFDAAAALIGFTRESSFEGQAAIWLEQIAHGAETGECWPMPFRDGELDWRPAIQAIVSARIAGMDRGAIARAFHRGLARGTADAIRQLADAHGLRTVVLSGGVFQNDLLLRELQGLLEDDSLLVWTNRSVPANDGGISLGQAAIASVAVTST